MSKCLVCNGDRFIIKDGEKIYLPSDDNVKFLCLDCHAKGYDFCKNKKCENVIYNKNEVNSNEYKLNFKLPSEYFNDDILKIIEKDILLPINKNDFCSNDCFNNYCKDAIRGQYINQHYAANAKEFKNNLKNISTENLELADRQVKEYEKYLDSIK